MERNVWVGMTEVDGSCFCVGDSHLCTSVGGGCRDQSLSEGTDGKCV